MNKLKKGKMEKGITLIALIITIVVLLILAVVAIRAVQVDGIINYAKNASSEYGKAQDKEKDILEYYESYLEGTVGQWQQKGSEISMSASDGTKITLHIGDYVNYDEGTLTADTVDRTESGYTSDQSYLPTNDLNWRVLGVNADGQLELISDTPTYKTFYLKCQVGWQNAETTLDTVCNNLYGKGIYAASARSLDVDDIDKLSNFDKSSYGSGNLYAYGNKVTYYWQGTNYPYYSGTNGKKGSLSSSHATNGFKWFDKESNTWKISAKSTTATTTAMEEITTLESDYYSYSIASNITTDDGFTSEEATAISNMISKGTGTSNVSQWLASRCVSCYTSYASFAVCYVFSGSVGGDYLYSSYGRGNTPSYRVRPVVSLKSDIQIDNSDSTRDGSSAELAWKLK